MQRAAWILPLTIPILTVAAEPRDSAAPSFAEARRLYYAGVEGDREAAQKSRGLLEALVQERSHDPLVLAYFGSTKLLESAKTLALWRKGRLAKEGLEALDQAVAGAPEDLEVRFVRAVTTFHLPGFFKRKQQSREDFAKIAPVAEGAVSSGRLDARLAAAALFHHGLFLEEDSKREQARQAWEAAVRIGPDTRAGRDAAKRLD